MPLQLFLPVMIWVEIRHRVLVCIPFYCTHTQDVERPIPLSAEDSIRKEERLFTSSWTEKTEIRLKSDAWPQYYM